MEGSKIVGTDAGVPGHDGRTAYIEHSSCSLCGGTGDGQMPGSCGKCSGRGYIETALTQAEYERKYLGLPRNSGKWIPGEQPVTREWMRETFAELMRDQVAAIARQESPEPTRAILKHDGKTFTQWVEERACKECEGTGLVITALQPHGPFRYCTACDNTGLA